MGFWTERSDDQITMKFALVVCFAALVACEPEAKPEAEADPALLYSHYGYAGYPYAYSGLYHGYAGYHAGYPYAYHYGKRSADAEAEPEADAYYGYYGYARPYGYGYRYGGYAGYRRGYYYG